jgi:hypothetical protein
VCDEAEVLDLGLQVRALRKVSLELSALILGEGAEGVGFLGVVEAGAPGLAPIILVSPVMTAC